MGHLSSYCKGLPSESIKTRPVLIKAKAKPEPEQTKAKPNGMFGDLACDSGDEDELSPNVTVRVKPMKVAKEMDWGMMSDDEDEL